MKFNGVESAMLATDVAYGDHRWAVEDCLATQSTVSPRSQQIGSTLSNHMKLL